MPRPSFVQLFPGCNGRQWVLLAKIERTPKKTRPDVRSRREFRKPVSIPIMRGMNQTAALIETLAGELRGRIAGEVRFDEMTRGLYSTDASIYQISPVGVVFPKTKSDVRAAIEAAVRHRVPILPRGSGTSLSGQTVAAALVIDFSRFMNRILDIDLERRLVRVEPCGARRAARRLPDVILRAGNQSGGGRAAGASRVLDRAGGAVVLRSAVHFQGTARTGQVAGPPQRGPAGRIRRPGVADLGSRAELSADACR
ncbi:MAG: FAD-binding oxidoreductase [Planctomycetia bacterium]|nr:FAD-binding oxidoreductase [Planctomycetia bacterium]